MAAQDQSSLGSSPTAQVIGNAFVQQYYLILHQSPELVHRFYQEQSKLGRPPPDGDMLSVTTLQAINQQILAMDLMKAEIKTVDSQESLDGGVVVLVTGEITSHADVTREFTQTFFLAPQEKGYFVLNDLFRYSSGEGVKGRSVEVAVEMSNGAAAQESEVQQVEVTSRSLPPPTESDNLPIQEDQEVYITPSTNGEPPADIPAPEEEDETPVPEVINEPPPVVAVSNNVVVSPLAVAADENAPKKSYASIVKVMKLAAPFSAPAPAVRSRAVAPVAYSAPAVKVEKQEAPVVTVKPAESNPSGFSSNTNDNSTPVQELDDGHSIYVRNLPLSATPEQLEEEFTKFGTIRPGGIQVRSHKLQGFCYGFVEFEDAASVQNAIAASPVTLSDRQCFVEEKRAGGYRGGGNRGRFSGPRGGPNDRPSGSFRNEGPRSGRGGRGGYGREFNNNNNNYRGGARGGPGPRGPGPRSPVPAPAPVSTGAK